MLYVLCVVYPVPYVHASACTPDTDKFLRWWYGVPTEEYRVRAFSTAIAPGRPLRAFIRATPVGEMAPGCFEKAR